MAVQTLTINRAAKDSALQLETAGATVGGPQPAERPVYRIGSLPPPEPGQTRWTPQALVDSFERQLAAYDARVNEYNTAVDLFNEGRGPDPGDWTGTPPQFDQESYSRLLLSEFEQELAGQKAQFDLARKAEEEKYLEKKAEFEKEQKILAEENARAQAAAEAASKAAEEQAAQARGELEKRRVQFREETEGLQRNAGAQRAGYVRARRIRSRPLLGF